MTDILKKSDHPESDAKPIVDIVGPSDLNAAVLYSSRRKERLEKRDADLGEFYNIAATD